MAKPFTIPPVVFPTHSSPTAPQPRTQPLPFMSFNLPSSPTTTTSYSHPPPTNNNPYNHNNNIIPSSFLDVEPPLLEELEINPSLILHKTLSLFNPLNPNPALHSHNPDLSGPFLYYLAFSLFQLLAGKLQFGIILGWVVVSSIFLYATLNFVAGNNDNNKVTLDVYKCVSVVGYCLLPIVLFSGVNLLLLRTLDVGTKVGFAVAGVFVVWATGVCSRLLSEEDELGIGGVVNKHRGLIAYPCFLIYSLFSMLVMF